MAAARVLAGSAVMKGLRRIEPVLVRDSRSGLSIFVSISTGERPSAADGISSVPAIDCRRRFFSSEKGSDALLREAVKRGVETGLSEELKKLKSDVGSVIRLSVVQEAVNAGVHNALKDANLSFEPVLPGSSEEQMAIKMAVKDGFYEAVKEMGQCRSGKDFCSDAKFVEAMVKFTTALNDFMKTQEMFTEEDVGEGGEPVGAVSDLQKTTKGKRSKFDLFIEKYNEDTTENVRVLKILLSTTEEVKQQHKKDKDFIAEWCTKTAEGFFGKDRMEQIRKAKTAVPWFGKGYFYYLLVKMMGESGIPPWHYPMVVRATRLLLAKQAMDIYNESRNPKKPEDKPEDKDDGPKPE